MENLPVSTPPSNLHGKRNLIVVVIVISLILICVVIVLFLINKGDQADKQQGVDKKTNSLSKVMVGESRYVNACNAFTLSDSNQYFAQAAPGAYVTNTYAEASPEDEDFTTEGSVESKCSREFASNSAYDGADITFTVVQFKSAADAKKYYDSQYDSSEEAQVEADAGARPLSGVKDTLYAPSTQTSSTLVDNKILEFSGLLGDKASETDYTNSIIKSLPGVIANVKNNSLKQEWPGPTKTDASNKNQPVSLYGDKIGDATYLNPCKIFTTGDFTALTGQPSSPVKVKLGVHYGATSAFTANASSGFTQNKCERRTASSNRNGGKVALDIAYFKTAKEAKRSLKATMDKQRNRSADGEFRSATFSDVEDVGDYAVFRLNGKDDLGPNNGTSLFVQKGPYRLEIVGGVFGTERSALLLSNYKKAASEILKQLP